MSRWTFLAGLATLLVSGLARADINVGVILSLTGPGSGLGVPMQHQLRLFPKKIAGEQINLHIVDDGSDASRGVSHAKRLIAENKVDVILGPCLTPVAAAVAPVTAESGTLQIAASPVGVPRDQERWLFRLPQGNDVMAEAVVDHMKRQGVRTIGFLGYADAYGELWLAAVTRLAEKAGLRFVAIERFARTDHTVDAQAARVVAGAPDAILVVASGSGAALPHRSVVARGFKGRIYQTHAAATPDLVRLGGPDVEGAYVVMGPAVIADLLPSAHPSRTAAMEFVKGYETLMGAGSRNQFAAHSYDFHLVMEKIVPVALAKARPGTPAFRAALRDAMETIGRTVLAHGVVNWTAQDHWGYTPETGVILKIARGKFIVDESSYVPQAALASVPILQTSPSIPSPTVSPSPQATSSQHRAQPTLIVHALIIGNSIYPGSARLRNPVNDATEIAQKLRGFGFNVSLVANANRSRMVAALSDFANRAAKSDLTLLFYAGHGAQVNGINYLVPVDFDMNQPTQLSFQGIALDTVLEQFMPGRTRLVFLDACRDNPMLVSGTRGGSRGLAPVAVGQGTLISYATKDGATASDGDGRNSPFTSALLAHLDDPVDIGVMLRKVRQHVITSTKGQQQPWEYGSLVGDELVLSRIQVAK